MPACSLKQCGERKNKKHPTLTLHRFPVNEVLKNKWLEVIGSENINPRHKIWYVCSMHFDESCINRCLNVPRLYDGAIPSSCLLPNHVEMESCTSSEMVPEESSNPISHERLPEANLNMDQQIETIRKKNDRIKYLTRRCDLLKKKIKSLQARVRRRDEKIGCFSDIIEDIRKRNLINNEET